jgi:hypothetical protein
MTEKLLLFFAIIFAVHDVWYGEIVQQKNLTCVHRGNTYTDDMCVMDQQNKIENINIY